MITSLPCVLFFFCYSFTPNALRAQNDALHVRKTTGPVSVDWLMNEADWQTANIFYAGQPKLRALVLKLTYWTNL